jgi:hypothetical protein
VPGDIYYRLPTIGIINDQDQGIEKRMEGENLDWQGETEELLTDDGRADYFMNLTDILLVSFRTIAIEYALTG